VNSNAAKTRATRIVTLTNRAPVKIFVDEWNKIAKARGDSFRGPDYGPYMQSLHRGELNVYTLEVLQHRDGRTLVSATLVPAVDGDTERRGELLQQGAEIPAAIRRVGDDCDLPDRIIRACVDALPPEDLDVPAPAPQRNVGHSHHFTERAVLSDTEHAVLHMLREILPASARAYEQALRDIAQPDRISWRGTATELREVLREVMDHLAPDDQVMASPGFQLEEPQPRPTQRQKVRFILRSRRSLSAAVAVAEASLSTVEEAVASLVRTTYTRGSVSTHTATDGAEIRNLKRYVEALLAELLEIS
jgi:hypothetical protein